jgi:hypothetical protein
MTKIETRIDTWLTLPEANAAGRLGLYRIIFVMMYYLLATTTVSNFSNLSSTPANAWYPTPLLMWMSTPPSANILALIVIVNIMALVLLGIGWHVRLMTFIVLVTGILIGAFSASVGGKVDHSRTFREVYIPFMMLFSSWGDTFSLDAVLRHRRGETVTDPTDSSFQYSWVFKALLLLLAILFMMSGIVKGMPPGQWLTDTDLMRKVMLDHNRDLQDYTRFVIASLPLVPFILQMMALMFETFYPLVLINKTWRRFYLSSSVFFHIGTKISLNIWFWSMLFLYIFFFDIYNVYQRFFPHRLLYPFKKLAQTLPSWALVLLTWVTSGCAVYIRNDDALWRIIGGTVHEVVFNEIWIVAGLLGAYGIVTALIGLYRNFREGRLFEMDIE